MCGDCDKAEISEIWKEIIKKSEQYFSRRSTNALSKIAQASAEMSNDKNKKS